MPGLSTDLTFEWAGLRLAGTLHLPSGPGPHPAAVMAQGSGPADRESGGYFGPIRQALLDRGVATFAFDKPGCGHSTGDWRRVGLPGRAEQLVAALDLVRAQPAVDPDRVGLWGHSQGAWLVQMLAGRPIELAFAVASSGPTIGVAEQIRYDEEQALRAKGHDDRSVEAARAMHDALHRAAIDDVGFDEVVRHVLEPVSGNPWYADCRGIADADADDWRHLKLLIGQPFEPLAALGRVECPFLAVFGGLDTLLPAWQGAEEAGRALARSACVDATVIVFPNGDHRLQTGGGTAFVEGYLELLGQWVGHRVARSG